MAIRQVLLNGSGTSGDGTTWNDLSDATSAYIGVAGFSSAVGASAGGDILYVKGVGSSATQISLPAVGWSTNPLIVLGCKSTTTNNQGAIVKSDLIPGFRTGNSTPAYDDADIPTLSFTSSASFRQNQAELYMYGIKIQTVTGVIYFHETNFDSIFLEECYLRNSGSGTIYLSFYTSTASGQGIALYKNCKFQSSNPLPVRSGIAEIIGGEVNSTDSLTIFGGSEHGGLRLYGVDLPPSTTPTRLYNKQTGQMPYTHISHCRLPAGIAGIGGTPTDAHRWEGHMWGCSTEGSGISTSIRAFDYFASEGSITTETVKIRTNGATDGAAGGYSHDFTASDTVPGYVSLRGPWMGAWIEGDGTSKTLTSYFVSDSANARSTDWDDDEVWLEVLYPDDAGSATYDFNTTQMNLLDTPSAVADDTVSTWGAGTKNPQKLQVTIAPDYQGLLYCRVHFAPGTGDSIYVDPEIEVA